MQNTQTNKAQGRGNTVGNFQPEGYHSPPSPKGTKTMYEPQMLLATRQYRAHGVANGGVKWVLWGREGGGWQREKMPQPHVCVQAYLPCPPTVPPSPASKCSCHGIEYMLGTAQNAAARVASVTPCLYVLV